MNEEITCREAQQHLTQIKFLERELQEFLVIANAETTISEGRTEAIQEARRIKITLEEEITFLVERVNPFERLFNLREQYQKQITTLETAQILETREINGEKIKGITDIEGEFHPLPTLKEVITRLREKKELLEIKRTQGFGKIRLIPFGMSLDVLIEKYKQVLIDHAKRKKLFTARYDRSGSNEEQVLLGLDMTNPLNIADEYEDADRIGKLVYGVTEFDPVNHGGKTKSEILKQRKKQKRSGWDILVLENNIHIQIDGQGEIIGGRKQIETEKSPKEYLKLLQTEFQYRGEVGLTPEESLIHAITELVDHCEVIDDYGGMGSKAYSIGGYFKESQTHFGSDGVGSGVVPYACFNRKFQNVELRVSSLTNKDYISGIRSGVRV